MQCLLLITVENFYFFPSNKRKWINHNLQGAKHVYLSIVPSHLSYRKESFKLKRVKIKELFCSWKMSVQRYMMFSGPTALRFSTLSRLCTSHKSFSVNGDTSTTVELGLHSGFKWSRSINPKTLHGSYAICLLDSPMQDGTVICAEGFWGLLLAAICFIDERAIAFPAWESKGYISIVAENLIDKQLLADKLGETESQKYDLLVCICYFEMNLYT